MGELLQTTMASTNCFTDNGPSLLIEISRNKAKKLGCVSCVKHGGGGGSGGGGAGVAGTGDSGRGEGILGGGEHGRDGSAASVLTSVSARTGVLSRSLGSGSDELGGSGRDFVFF